MIAPVGRDGRHYRLSVALLEQEEEKLWGAVRAIEEGDNGPGARSLRARHAAVMREILPEHTTRLWEATEFGLFLPASPEPASRHFTVYSDRKTEGKVTTWEATLLPSMGYRTMDDAETWAWNFRKANPKRKTEVR